MEPIGYIESCFKDKFGTPRQPGLVPEAWGRLRLRADLQPEESLQGLEGFSHIWLLWLFHQNKSARFHAKVHPPRLGGEKRGVFATRSPHRPNPIGLSLVELVQIEKDGLIVAGLDLVDGTPILDIKPYLPHIESRPDARMGWPAEVIHSRIDVLFTEPAAQQLQKWQQQHPEKDLKVLIEQTLQQDPRPTIYKGYETGESPYRQEHAVRLYDGDIHFRFETPTQVQILNILFLHN